MARIIDAVLFDADGVIQRMTSDWLPVLAGVLGSSEKLDEFVADVSAAERRALTGQVDFREILSEVLSRWQCRGTLEDVIGVWTMIEVEDGMVDAIVALRKAGVRCYLTTNQQPHRARYMSETLGYAGLFDREFYSCRIGLMKPDPQYFVTILREIDLPPGRVLFLDDHEVNVDSARQVGIRAVVFAPDGRPTACLVVPRTEPSLIVQRTWDR